MAKMWNMFSGKLSGSSESILFLYCSLTKEGPWAVHLTLVSERGVGQHSRYQYCVLSGAYEGKEYVYIRYGGDIKIIK